MKKLQLPVLSLPCSRSPVDRGITTAAETGVFGPDGDWLIEGHGVDPDIVVDNLPHQTFNGQDAQLDAAIKYLQDEMKRNPIPAPAAPKYRTSRSGGEGRSRSSGARRLPSRASIRIAWGRTRYEYP
jgi:hypothetical protein